MSLKGHNLPSIYRIRCVFKEGRARRDCGRYVNILLGKNFVNINLTLFIHVDIIFLPYFSHRMTDNGKFGNVFWRVQYNGNWQGKRKERIKSGLVN